MLQKMQFRGIKGKDAYQTGPSEYIQNKQLAN